MRTGSILWLLSSVACTSATPSEASPTAPLTTPTAVISTVEPTPPAAEPEPAVVAAPVLASPLAE